MQQQQIPSGPVVILSQYLDALLLCCTSNAGAASPTTAVWPISDPCIEHRNSSSSSSSSEPRDQHMQYGTLRKRVYGHQVDAIPPVEMVHPLHGPTAASIQLIPQAAAAPALLRADQQHPPPANSRAPCDSLPLCFSHSEYPFTPVSQSRRFTLIHLHTAQQGLSTRVAEPPRHFYII